MIIDVPHDFRRAVALHAPDGTDALETLLRRLLGVPDASAIPGERVAGFERHGFDEWLAIGGPDASILVPLLVGWPMAGDGRMPYGPLSGDDVRATLEATLGLVAAVRSGDEGVALSATENAQAANRLGMLMVASHPDDGEDMMLLHDDGNYVVDLRADRFTGLPYGRFCDSEYSDEDVDPSEHLEADDMLEIARRHVLHLALATEREDGRVVHVLARADRDVDPTPIHSVRPDAMEAVRVIAELRDGRPKSHVAS